MPNKKKKVKKDSTLSQNDVLSVGGLAADRQKTVSAEKQAALDKLWELYTDSGVMFTIVKEMCHDYSRQAQSIGFSDPAAAIKFQKEIFDDVGRVCYHTSYALIARS